MTRIPHDHPSIETVRATVERRGGSATTIAIPADHRDRFPDDVVRVVLGGDECHARIETGLADDRPAIYGVYPSPALARDPDADHDRLAGWIANRDRGPGDTVLVDVLSEGFRYGLRAPGEDATYEDRRDPDDGLASIAKDLEDRD